MRLLKNYPASFAIIVALSAVSPLQAQTYNWTTIAGNAGWGSADGTNSDGRFSAPVGIAADKHGNLFVTDYRSDTIRKLTPAGTNWVVSTLAGLPGTSGSADGTNSSARFNSPVGITVDAQGNIYVGDCYNYTIRKLTLAGTNWVVTTIAGKPGIIGSVDGTNNTAGFSFVYGVVADANGNVYVADGQYAIRKLTPVGTNWVVTTIAGNGSYGTADGTNRSAKFGVPEGLAIDPQGSLYETDRSHTVRRITPVGTNWVVTTLAGSAGTSGSTDGTNSTARFFYPGGLAADGQGHVLVADSNNHTIRCLNQQGTNWVVTTIAGLAGQFGDVDGSNSTARFYYPHDIAVGTNGIFYITDDDNYSIRSLMPVGTNWVAGSVAGMGGPESTDGTNNQARFDAPWAVAAAGNGNLYVADQKNDTIRQLSPAGTNWVVGTIAGAVKVNGNADGTNRSARFNAPSGMAADGDGNLYVADTGNGAIRKLTPAGTNWVVSTISQSFSSPVGVTVDLAGNIYVADAGNDTICMLSPTNSNWTLTTLAGLAGYAGYLDGTNSSARFYWPCGIAVDSAGNLFVADQESSTIRKVSPVGTNWVVTTIVGVNGSVGRTDGTNSNAHFWSPYGIAINRGGQLFVAEYINQTIRKITPKGTNWVVTTIGGLGSIVGLPHFVGTTDGTNSAARFNFPTGIAVDANDHVFVADSSNNAIREGVPVPVTFEAISVTDGILTLTWSAFPNQTYQVQFKTNLLQTSWSNLGDPVNATDTSATATDAMTDSQRFYRVNPLP
jgi:streptogramin lyase